MRLPAITPAARAQRHADHLARRMLGAPQAQLTELRRAYQAAAARAAAGTRTDIPLGVREHLRATLARPRTVAMLLGAALWLLLLWALRTYAPAAASDLRWACVGALVVLVGGWARRQWAVRREVVLCEPEGEDR
jgi:hypothetical protein